MGEKIHDTLNWINITPDNNANYWFGYYDRNPFSNDNKYHLVIRYNQQERLPKPGEKATVGIIDIKSKEFKSICETYAFCHQQGAMTEWLPHNISHSKQPEQFILNDFIKDENKRWKLISQVYDIDGENIRNYDYPTYKLSQEGNTALTLNFSRIPRRGYTYACAYLPEKVPVPDLDKDGLFLIDLDTGKRKLILNYRYILEHPVDPKEYLLEGKVAYAKYFHWMNHASFNIDDSRVMVLHRYQNATTPWKTDMWTLNVEENNTDDPICSLNHFKWKEWGITHQLWGRDPREILIDGWISDPNKDEKECNYWVFDESRGATEENVELVSRGTKLNGHLIFSPDFKYLLGDTYPNNNVQYLSLTRVEDKKIVIIGRFYHSKKQRRDWRCDLHPRWNNDGKYISIDTIHYGKRKVLILEVKEAIETLF